jgi:hypothetical protein
LKTGSNGGRLAVLGATRRYVDPLRYPDQQCGTSVSPLPRVSKQETSNEFTIQDKNIHCVAIEGNLDDCQTVMSFTPIPHGAVNSI